MRRRLLRVAALSCFLLFGAVAGFVAWTQTPHFERTVARAVAWRLGELLGERVVIGTIGVDWLRRAVFAEGVVVAHRSTAPDQDGQTIAALPRVELVLGVHAGRPVLRRLVLDRPAVSLHLDSDGLRELRALQLGDDDPGGAGPTSLPWRELEIRGGTFALDAGQAGVRVEGVDVRPIEGDGAMDVRFGQVSLRLGALEKVARKVDFPRASLRADRLILPQVALDFGDLQVHGSLAAILGGDLHGDLAVDASLPGLSPLLGPGWVLEGTAALELEVTGTTQSPAAKGAVVLDDVALAEVDTGAGGGLSRFEFGSMAGGWRFAGRQVFLESLVARWAEGIITVDGAMDLASTGTWATVTLEGASLYRAVQQADGAQAPWVDLVVDGELHAAGTLDPLDVAGSLSLASDRLVVAGGDARGPGPPILSLRAIALDGQLRLFPDHIVLDVDRLRTGRSSGAVRASIGFGGQGPLDLDFDFAQLDLGGMRPLFDLDLVGVGPARGRITGPFDDINIDGEARLSALGLLGYRLADDAVLPFHTVDLSLLRFDGFEARVGDSRASGALGVDLDQGGALDLQVIVQEGRVADLVGTFVEVPGLDGAVVGTVDLQGPGDALSGEVELQLADLDLWGERFPEGRLSAVVREGDWTLDDLGLWRQEGRESAVLRGTVDADGGLRLDLHAGGFELHRLDHLAPFAWPLRGALSLDARIGGSLSRPEPVGRLALRDTWLLDARVGDSTIAVESDATTLRFEGSLLGNAATTGGDLDLWQDQAWQVALDLRDFPAEMFYPRAADGGAVTARVSGAARFSGAFGRADGAPRVEATAERVELRWADQVLKNPAPWQFRAAEDGFELGPFGLAGGRTDLRFDGSRSPAEGTQLRGGGQVDLALARALVPDLQRVEGLATVSLSATGPRGAVVPRVQLEATDASFRGAWFPATFEVSRLRVEGSASGYSVEELTGRLGGGAFTASGQIDAEGWVPRRYDTRATVRGARVRYLDYLPPIVGDAELRFDGPVDDLLLSGRIDVSDMFFNERIDWESWVLEVSGDRLDSAVAAVDEDPLFALDLDLVARNTVRMRNNVGDLTASAELRFIGDTSRPGMIGVVDAQRGGRVYLKEREFELLRGELRWVDPYTYDPELDILLRTDVRAREQEYRIDYRVLGLYSNWSTETASDPPLAVADINALLLFGMTRSDLEQYGGLASVLATEGSDLLVSRFGIVEGVGEGVYRIGFIDEVLGQLRPDRLDLVSGASERGSGSISSDLRLLYEKDLVSLDPALAETRLIFEQNVYRVSDRYLGIEQKLARSLYARGFWSGEALGGPTVRGGAYGLEFHLRWEAD